MSGIPGVLLGSLILASVKEPDRHAADVTGQRKSSEELSELLGRQSIFSRLKEILKASMSPSLILLYLAGSIRNACK